jgi:ribosomal protein S12 methylthiotransferase accessory factor
MTGLDALVSPYVGVLRSLDELLAGTADPPLPMYLSDPVDDPSLLGAPLDAIAGACGIGLDHASAVSAALGETGERYSLSCVPRQRIVRSTAAALAGSVAPGRFGLFRRHEYAAPGFPFVPFTDETPVRWIDGWDVRTGDLAWLPAELVFVGDCVEPGEGRIGYATSSGAACAPTLDGAVLKGLFELLERDAFMIVWSSRLSLPLLDWSGDPRIDELDRRYFAPTGLDYATVDLSAFHGVPSVLGVVRAPRTEYGALGVGAGTAATIGEAWWKALSEAFACRAAAARLAMLGRGATVPDDPRHVQSFEDHILYYAAHENADRAAFLTASVERVDVRELPSLAGDMPAQIESLLDRVEACSSSAYAVDVTAPDIASLGVRVVKTVAPELCMLDVPHGARFLGNRRLLIAAAQCGLRARELTPDEINPDPHPFP